MLKDIVKKSSGLTGDAARAAYHDALQALERVYGTGNVWSKAKDSEIDALESIERSIGYQKNNNSSQYQGKETRLPSVGESMGKGDLKKILDDLASGDDAYYGIRSIPEGEYAQVGGGVLPSRVWKIGNDSEWLPTEEFSDGPSAISLKFPKYLDISEQYSGEKALLRSDDLLASQPWNIDPGEIVMRDPVVQAVFKSLPSGDWERIRSIAPYAAGAGLAGGLMSTPEDVWAGYNEPPRDAIEESWNPVEALAGGLGGGVASAFAGVPMDLAATIGMDKLGGLLSAPGGNATDYGNIRSWR